MIINVSSRTDIPSYYADWFYNRLKAGFVDVRNPYYPELVTRYSLRKEVTDGFVFCTKDPLPMLSRIDLLQAYKQYWMVTITPYGKDLEPNVRDKHQIMETFKQLSEIVGKKCMSWRYDPILITKKYSLEYHIHAFESMAKELAPYCDCCIISFLDLYVKTKQNFPQACEVTKQQCHQIIQVFTEIAKRYDLKLKTCAEGHEWEIYGIDTSGCLTQQVLEEAWDIRLKIPKKSPARQTCQCLLGNDMGAYSCCLHGCKYCYANDNKLKAEENYQLHDPNSSFLIGQAKNTDQLKEAEITSWIDNQLTLF